MCDFSSAFHWHCFSKLCREVCKAVCAEDRAFYQDLADHHSDESLPTLWKSLRAVLPKTREKKLRNLRCVGPAVDDMHQHFDSLEGGHRICPDELLARCHSRQRDRQLDGPLTVSLDQLPTRQIVERLILSQNSQRAPGLDGVRADTMKQLAQDHAGEFHSLFLKCFVLGAEPLQWKGGLLWSIPKKAAAITASSLRGVMMLSCLGKTFHALLRRHLMAWMQPRRLPGQLGGFKALQTSYAIQTLLSFAKVSDRRSISTALVLVDLRSAFHTLLRENAFGVADCYPYALAQTLEDEGLDPVLLRNNIPVHSAEFLSSAPICTQRALQDAHVDAWYKLANSDELHCTARGSRPGSPLADAAFNHLMRLIMIQVDGFLLEQVELQDTWALYDAPVPSLAWMDDLCIPLATKCGRQLDELICHVVAFLDTVFAAYGMTMNYAQGKTEVLCTYRGRDAAALRKNRFVTHLGTFALPSGQMLRSVAQYQHLGTVITQSLSCHQNIRVRIGKASQVFRQLAKAVFCNPRKV